MALTYLQTGALDPAAYGFTHRNRVHNGNFTVWQRGTSISVPASGTTYTADRWFVTAVNGTTAGTAAAVQSLAPFNFFDYPLTTDPTGNAFSYQSPSLPMASYAALTFGSAAAATVVSACQRIESIMMADLVGQTVTVSFGFLNLYAVAGATLVVNIDTPATADTYTSTLTRIVSTTVGSLSGQTFANYIVPVPNLPASVANGIQISFSLTSSTAAQLGGSLGLVQLETGPMPTMFEFRPIPEETLICQRYYQQASILSLVRRSASGDYGGGVLNHSLAAPMRVAPAMTLWSSATPRSGTINDFTYNGGTLTAATYGSGNQTLSGTMNGQSTTTLLRFWCGSTLATVGDYASFGVECSADL